MNFFIVYYCVLFSSTFLPPSFLPSLPDVYNQLVSQHNQRVQSKIEETIENETNENDITKPIKTVMIDLTSNQNLNGLSKLLQFHTKMYETIAATTKKQRCIVTVKSIDSVQIVEIALKIPNPIFDRIIWIAQIIGYRLFGSKWKPILFWVSLNNCNVY